MELVEGGVGREMKGGVERIDLREEEVVFMRKGGWVERWRVGEEGKKVCMVGEGDGGL